MSRAALLRADGGRQGDPLAAAEAILARAADAGRSITFYERATIRAHVRQYEDDAGETLLAAAERIVACGGANDGLLPADSRQRLARLLDIAEALG